MVILKNEAYKVATVCLVIRMREICKRVAKGNYASAVKGVKTAKNIEQGGLSRAAFAYYKHHTALGEHEIYPVKRTAYGFRL